MRRILVDLWAFSALTLVYFVFKFYTLLQRFTDILKITKKRYKRFVSNCLECLRFLLCLLAMYRLLFSFFLFMETERKSRWRRRETQTRTVYVDGIIKNGLTRTCKYVQIHNRIASSSNAMHIVNGHRMCMVPQIFVWTINWGENQEFLSRLCVRSIWMGYSIVEEQKKTTNSDDLESSDEFYCCRKKYFHFFFTISASKKICVIENPFLWVNLCKSCSIALNIFVSRCLNTTKDFYSIGSLADKLMSIRGI